MVLEDFGGFPPNCHPPDRSGAYMPDHALSLLNIFEVEADGEHRHLVCFQDAVLAGSVGLDERSIIGEFTPDPGGGFDTASFRLNPAFQAAASEYLESEVIRAPRGRRRGRSKPGRAS